MHCIIVPIIRFLLESISSIRLNELIVIRLKLWL